MTLILVCHQLWLLLVCHQLWLLLVPPPLVTCLCPRQNDGVLASRVWCGHQFSLVLSKEGRLYAFGRGDNGRTGVGKDAPMRTPTPIPGLAGECCLWVLCRSNYWVLVVGRSSWRMLLAEVVRRDCYSVATPVQALNMSNRGHLKSNYWNRLVIVMRTYAPNLLIPPEVYF